MSRYYWDIKNLRRDLADIEKRIKRETNLQKKNELRYLYDQANSSVFNSYVMPDNPLPLTYRFPTVYSSFLEDQRFYRLLTVFDEALQTNYQLFCNTNKSSKDIDEQIEKATGVSVSRGKSISLCYDFYKELDDEFFNMFLRFYNQRFNHLRFSKQVQHIDKDTVGLNYQLSGFNIHYLDIEGSNSPDMVFTLIHEMAHILDSYINPNDYKYRDYYYEVISIFMELVAAYKRVGNFSDLLYNAHLMNDVNGYAMAVDNLYDLQELLSEYKKNNYVVNRDFYKRVDKELNFNKKSINDLVCSETISDIVYPLSFPFAMYFFSIYKRDEKRGLDELKKFLRTTDRNQYTSLLESKELQKILNNEFKSLLENANESFKSVAK